MSRRADGRHFAHELLAKVLVDEASGEVSLVAPTPGLWREAPQEGALVRGGDAIGELEVLGVLYRLHAPTGVFGVVRGLPEGRHLARRPVDAASRLFVLDPEGVRAGADELLEASRGARGGPVFRCPLGGRYYASPSPGAEPFVREGALLEGGETVALIEVMKTFNRVQYAGEPARVLAVVPRDGDDLEAGSVLLELGPR